MWIHIVGRLNADMVSTPKYGVAVLAPNENGVSGVVRFSEKSGTLHIDYDIRGMSDGEHGFHVHEYGDLTDGCESACSHFNPYGETHGGLESEVRHLGDLGNITSKDGVAKGRLSTDTISLNPKKVNCIVGRMIIVHADKDDLGLGGDAESLKTGNAGKRLACGVIGFAEPPKNMTKKAEHHVGFTPIFTGATLGGFAGFLFSRFKK